MANNLLLYSTNTLLAFHINDMFYNNVHYVWCSSVFRPDASTISTLRSPPSSTPYNIYVRLQEDVEGNDLHSSKINENKEGIKEGANQKLSQKVISKQQFDTILQIVGFAQISHFRPLLYVIPYHLVKNKLKVPPINSLASPLSKEYIIHNLVRNEFEIIDFNK